MLNTLVGRALAVFLKLGGTWDMIQQEDGTMAGSGSMDDEAIRNLEEMLGLNSPTLLNFYGLEMAMAISLYQSFRLTGAEVNAGDHFNPWCPSFGELVDAPFVPLYSGDSSHLRHSFVAAMIQYIIDQLKRDPKRIVLGAQGTDTADVALLPLLDVLLHDTGLPPVILAGANRSHREDRSDAPANFEDLAQVCSVEMGAGAFWVFGGYVFRGCDLTKIDPQETRRVEQQTTFFSSHRTSMPVKVLVQHGKAVDPERWCLGADHMMNGTNLLRLYQALEEVYTVDLGNQNSPESAMEAMMGTKHRAIIVAAHSLGNVSNLMKNTCVELARSGRLVIDSSRCLIGDVNARYEGSLMGANNKELAGSGASIIGAHKLGKATARAVAVRAILEGLDQSGTQDLFDSYCAARELI